MTSAELPMGRETVSLSLTSGGPSFRLERWLGLDVRLLRRVVVVVAVCWGGALAWGLVDMALRPGAAGATLLRFGGHARLLIGIPLLLFAEHLLEIRAAAAGQRLVAWGIVDDASLPAWQRDVARIQRLRDARLPELAILLAIVAITGAGLLEILPSGFLRWFAPTLHPSVRAGAPGSFTLWWFVAVAQPIFFFLLFRCLWHWGLWATALARLARLKLRLPASHPDRAGGIGFLEESLDAFALVVLCVASALAASWGDEILATGGRAATFAPYFLGQLALALVVGLAPFLSLTPALYRAKREGAAAYSRFARVYVEDFDDRWIGARSQQTPLGTPDLQSLADLGGSFDVITEMRLTVFSRRWIVNLVAFALVPIAPLVLSAVPATTLAHKLIELLL